MIVAFSRTRLIARRSKNSHYTGCFRLMVAFLFTPEVSAKSVPSCHALEFEMFPSLCFWHSIFTRRLFKFQGYIENRISVRSDKVTQFFQYNFLLVRIVPRPCARPVSSASTRRGVFPDVPFPSFSVETWQSFHGFYVFLTCASSSVRLRTDDKQFSFLCPVSDNALLT